MRDSDTRHGNHRLGKITGTDGKPTIKSSGKLTDVAALTNLDND